MAYSKNTWNNLDPATPLNAARMNKIEAGIESANAIIGNDGKVTDSGLPARLSDATLRAALGSADPVLGSFVYDGSGNLTSYTEDGIAIVLTYNADGTVATSKRGTAATKTYSYSGGNLAGVA